MKIISSRKSLSLIGLEAFYCVRDRNRIEYRMPAGKSQIQHLSASLNHLTSESANNQNSRKILNFIL